MDKIKPRILVDKQIPFVEAYFSAQFNIEYFDNNSLSLADMQFCQAMLIRSVTKINQQMIPVIPPALKLIATASSGSDHIDKRYLRENNIAYYAAQGCNALAVSEYVTSVIAHLQKSKLIDINKPLRCAIVGVGHVGKLVEEKCIALGITPVVCDPIRHDNEAEFSQRHTALSQALDVDILTLHTPLRINTIYPTLDLIDTQILSQLKPGAIVINAARGGVIKQSALVDNHSNHTYILDTYTNEPYIDTNILDLCELTTPHIAGHAIDAKRRGTAMCYEAFCSAFDLDSYQHTIEQQLKHSIDDVRLKPVTIDFKHQAINWFDAVLAAYDPAIDTQHLKTALLDANEPAKVASQFTQIRNNYAIRREFTQINLINFSTSSQDRARLKRPGFSIRLSVAASDSIWRLLADTAKHSRLVVSKDNDI